MRRKEFMQAIQSRMDLEQADKLGIDTKNVECDLTRITIDLDRVHHWEENTLTYNGEIVPAVIAYTFEGDFPIMYKYDDFTKLMNQ